MSLSLKFDGTAQISAFGHFFYAKYKEVCKSVEERMRKTQLWKNAKPSSPGSSLLLLPTALLPLPLLRCCFRRRATPERREAIQHYGAPCVASLPPQLPSGRGH